MIPSCRHDFSCRRVDLAYHFGVPVNHRNIRTHKAHIYPLRTRCHLASKVILIMTSLLPELRKLFSAVQTSTKSIRPIYISREHVGQIPNSLDEDAVLALDQRLKGRLVLGFSSQESHENCGKSQPSTSSE